MVIFWKISYQILLILQKPQIIFSELRDFVAGEMGEDFGHHFRVFDCNR